MEDCNKVWLIQNNNVEFHDDSFIDVNWFRYQ